MGQALLTHAAAAAMDSLGSLKLSALNVLGQYPNRMQVDLSC